MELMDRHSEGVIALTGCLQSRFCRRLVEERPADARAHLDELLGVFGPENVYFEIQANGLAEQEKANEGVVRMAKRARPAAGGDGRRPLPAPRGLLEPRGASLRADQVHDRAAEAALRDQRVLPQEPRRDERVVRALARGGAEDARDRRALRGGDRARAAPPAALSHPRGRGADRDAATARHRGPAPSLRRSGPRGGSRAARVRALGDRGDGLRLLLPDRLGLRQVRQGQRRRRRPGTRLRGGLDRRLLPQHHGPRPARQRAALRAFPQPGAQVDAGHRHRLLGPRSRARDSLRG